MVRCLLVVVFFLVPALVTAEDRLQPLEEAARQQEQLQPGLGNYIAGIETGQIETLLKKAAGTATPRDATPGRPEFTWYWVRGMDSLIVPRDHETVDPLRENIANQLADRLAAISERNLIPPGKADLRREVAEKATIKTTDSLLGEILLKRIELSFAEPIALQGAFYTKHLTLPQDEIKNLYFDIDAKTHTIQEIGLLFADSQKLTAEIRYHEIPGGLLAERFKVTSPDGSIDNLLQITYTEVEGFFLPGKIVRKIHQPEQQDDFTASFVDHQINQPLPDRIRMQRDHH